MADRINTTKCFLRKAVSNDIDILFRWTNDSETRLNSFDQHIVSWEEHEKWFDKMMKDINRDQYIMMNGDNPVGQIRFDISNEVALISYSIAPEERGKGYGKQIIDLAKSEICENHPSVSILKAEIKPDNKASIRCFEQNGFIEKYRMYEIEMLT